MSIVIDSPVSVLVVNVHMAGLAPAVRQVSQSINQSQCLSSRAELLRLTYLLIYNSLLKLKTRLIWNEFGKVGRL